MHKSISEKCAALIVCLFLLGLLIALSRQKSSIDAFAGINSAETALEPLQRYQPSQQPSQQPLFFNNLTISNTAPTFTLTDTTASADSFYIAVDANLAKFYSSASSSPPFIIDLATNAATFSGSVSSSGPFLYTGTGYPKTGDVFFGIAGNDTMTGTYNSGFGYQVLQHLTSGVSNTAVGRNAGAALTTGSTNTALGNDALAKATGSSYSVAIGNGALNANNGNYNTAVGTWASGLLTAGIDNTTVGYDAQGWSTTGNYDVAVGFQALYYASGDYNTAVGAFALNGVSVAESTGSGNTAIGMHTGTVFTSAANNTLVGMNGGIGITSGGYNVCLGADACGSTYPVTTGTLNVFLGAFAGLGSASQLDNAIAVGYEAVPVASNTAIIGNASITDAYFGSSTAAATAHAKLFQTHTAVITATGSGTAVFLTDGIAGTGGPTTGTQNGWLKMNDSNGATIWIPVWK